MAVISIAHSPDLDDYFMFWALRNKLIDSQGYSFSFSEASTDLLNCHAKNALFDICAISVACYADVLDHYLIMSQGASIGRAYGPKIIASKELSLNELNHLRIAIPGETTTAACLLRQIAPKAKTIIVPIEPFDAIFQALQSGIVDAALVIHEGQISYARQDVILVLDLGQWWQERYQLPLPLGINVIKRSLGADNINQLSQIISDSIRFAIENRESLIDDIMEARYLKNISTSDDSQKKLTRNEALEYLDLYANTDSLKINFECKKAIELILYGLDKSDLDPSTKIEYVE